MKANGLFAVLLLCSAAALVAEDDFFAKVDNSHAEMRSGNLNFKIDKRSPNFTITTPYCSDKFSLYMGRKCCAVDEFRIAYNTPDRKILVWVGKPVETNSYIAQFTCEYEIRRGLPVLFVRSRLYNRDEAGPASCYFLWSFPMRSNTLESAGGIAKLTGPYQRIANVKNWLFSAASDKQGGIGIITDGLDITIQRRFFSDWTNKKWEDQDLREKATWMLASNFGGTGLKLWSFELGEYNSINFAVFPAKNKEECTTMFKKLSETAIAPLWKYDGLKGR